MNRMRGETIHEQGCLRYAEFAAGLDISGLNVDKIKPMTPES